MHDYEEKVKSLSIELVQVRARLQVAEKKTNEPPPFLLKLQEELSQMKVHVMSVCVMAFALSFILVSYSWLRCDIIIMWYM